MIKDTLQEAFDWVLEQLGYISKKEYVLRGLTKEKQRRS